MLGLLERYVRYAVRRRFRSAPKQAALAEDNESGLTMSKLHLAKRTRFSNITTMIDAGLVRHYDIEMDEVGGVNEAHDVNILTRAQLDDIGQSIANLSLRIDVAKHELLTQLRTFDEHDGWANSGFLSLAAWLAWRIDIGPVAAREYVRVARALGELKLVDAAFAAGKLSYSKVRAITRAATAETEQDFLDISTNATASQIERLSAGIVAFASTRNSRRWISGDSFVAATPRAGWFGSKCSSRPSRPRSCGRPCRRRSVLGENGPTLPRKRTTSHRPTLPRKRSGPMRSGPK